jgi:DNA-binding transcriptional LysR family regulator
MQVMTKLQHLAWDDFKLVKTIAEARGLAGAAERLSVNHSTVFRRLGQIEEGLGVKLFERHRTGYALTAAGEEMTSLAERMEEDVATFARKLAGQAVSPAGELRVTTNDTLLVHLLTPLFARFANACPDVRLDVVLTNQALNLSKRDADVAIRATDSPPETLVGRRVASIGWAIYGRAADFPNAGEIDLVDLYERPWVALADNLAVLKAARFVRDRVAPERIVYKVNTVLGLAEAVENGIGVGPLPCFIADVRPSLVRLTPPNPDFAAGLWLLTHPDLRQSARVRAFMDFMAAEIAKQRRMIEGPDVPSEEKRKAS